MKYQKEITPKLMIKNIIENRNILKFPLFISYPRSGAHWINYIMEIYFNRPRLRKSRVTALHPSRIDWMWMHDHDENLKWIKKILKLKEKGKYKFKKILYLYRNPNDVLKSHIKLKRIYYGKNLDPTQELEKIKNHQKTYLSLPFVVGVRYENFKDKNKRANEFKKICDFF